MDDRQLGELGTDQGAPRYRHTQNNPVLAVVSLVLAAAAVALAVWAEDPGGWIAAAAMVVAAVLVWGGSRLTVVVGSEATGVEFRHGWPNRRIDHVDVARVEVVRNPWWYGWGYRVVPGGTMFNVAGRDAVELRLTSGRTFRIGTDEPDRLRSVLIPLTAGE